MCIALASQLVTWLLAKPSHPHELREEAFVLRIEQLNGNHFLTMQGTELDTDFLAQNPEVCFVLKTDSDRIEGYRANGAPGLDFGSRDLEELDFQVDAFGFPRSTERTTGFQFLGKRGDGKLEVEVFLRECRNSDAGKHPFLVTFDDSRRTQAWIIFYNGEFGGDSRRFDPLDSVIEKVRKYGVASVWFVEPFTTPEECTLLIDLSGSSDPEVRILPSLKSSSDIPLPLLPSHKLPGINPKLQ